MNVELSIFLGWMNGGVLFLLILEKVEGKLKLSLVDLVIFVVDDLFFLNDNL